MTPAEPLIPFAAFASQLDARATAGSAPAQRAGAKAAVVDEPVVDRMRERALEMGIEMGEAPRAAAPRAARGSSPNLRR